MSEDSVAVVREMLEAFVRGDVAAALSAFDPDVEWDGTNLPDGKVSRGVDGVMEHMRSWARIWDEWEVEVEEVISAGTDQVIAFLRERGRSAAGVELDERHSELYRVRAGKIVARKGFSDADRALDAAGLS